MSSGGSISILTKAAHNLNIKKNKLLVKLKNGILINSQLLITSSVDTYKSEIESVLQDQASLISEYQK